MEHNAFITAGVDYSAAMPVSTAGILRIAAGACGGARSCKRSPISTVPSARQDALDAYEPRTSSSIPGDEDFVAIRAPRGPGTIAIVDGDWPTHCGFTEAEGLPVGKRCARGRRVRRSPTVADLQQAVRDPDGQRDGIDRSVPLRCGSDDRAVRRHRAAAAGVGAGPPGHSLRPLPSGTSSRTRVSEPARGTAVLER